MNGIHDSQEWFLLQNLGTGCSICCFEYRKTSLEGHVWLRKMPVVHLQNCLLSKDFQE